MSEFDHPNVLTLTGVCLDGGPAPYIVMPFLFNESFALLSEEDMRSPGVASSTRTGFRSSE